MYIKPNSNVKLNKMQVLEAMENGATLKKTYCVYSYFSLIFPDGSVHYNIRKGATNGISEITMKNIVRIESNKSGFSLKMSPNKTHPNYYKMTPLEFKNKLEISQAKECGFKSVNSAIKSGYNITRLNATLQELMDTYNISRPQAERIADNWKFNGLIQRNRVCNLDQIVFI